MRFSDLRCALPLAVALTLVAQADRLHTDNVNVSVTVETFGHRLKNCDSTTASRLHVEFQVISWYITHSFPRAMAHGSPLGLALHFL